MSKNIQLKHSVIKEDPMELQQSKDARYRGPEIEDEDLDIYSKSKIKRFNVL